MTKRERSDLASSAVNFPLLGLLALLLCSGCIARHVLISEKGLTCVDAHRIAIEAVRRLGYTISETKKAMPGSPGVIVASRDDGTRKRGLMVSVVCTTVGVEVEAKTDQGGLTEMNFPSEFRRSFEAAAANQPPPRPAAESGVDVLLTPERGGALANLGTELNNLGILAVSVRITNRTKRAYRFHIAAVVLQATTGARVAPLAATEIAPRLTAEAAAVLRQKTLTDRDIASNETLTGLLFFPFASYTRARVELTDRQSDESEGFSIEF